MAVVGLVTFPLFILEESIQTATWGTWSAQTANDPKLQLAGVKVIEKINLTMDTINRILDWLQPLSMLSYDAYSQATQVYVDSVKAKLLAQSPEIFAGDRIQFEFHPHSLLIREDGRYELVNGKIAVVFNHEPKLAPLKVEGVLQEIDGRIVVVME